MKRVLVAAGVIRHADQVLIAQRLSTQHQGGLWEFPGGKVEPGESIQAALARELEEELGIVPTQAQPLIRIEHDYPDKKICLNVWEVTAFTGEPVGREGQPLQWVPVTQLSQYAFPAANLPIVSAACLPAYYAITPDIASDDEVDMLLSWAEATLAKGIRLLLLRAPQLSYDAYCGVAQSLLSQCQAAGAQLMLHGNLQYLQAIPNTHGIHLPFSALKALSSRPIVPTKWFSASVHSAEELCVAEKLGVDFVTLSPVQKTQTHPTITPLGWEQFQQIVLSAKCPVYALGGLCTADLAEARRRGAQGVAAIRGL